MKKVLLINSNTERFPYPVPPLGLCLLAGAIEDRYQIKVYDGVFDRGERLPEILVEFQPDFVGIGIRNVDDVVADRVIFYPEEIVKRFVVPVREFTSAILIAGGSGFTIFPEELMAYTGADFGIAGEGEWLFPALLDYLSEGVDPSGLPNIYISAGSDIVKSKGQVAFGQRGFLPDYAEMDRYIDFTPYISKGVYSIQTKRGCAHGCIYCTYPRIEGKHFRTRDPYDVAKEIEMVSKRLGKVTFEFVDSTFNDPPGHAEAICRAIISMKLHVRLRTMGINPRNVSDELFLLMKQAGFVQIDATPDSASPKMLKSLRKGFTRRDAEKMALLLRKHDLPAMWFFLFGGPGEDKESFAETLDFIDRFVNPDDLVYLAAGMRIYPGTPLYRVAVREGKIHPGDSVFKPPVFYFSSGLPKDVLDELIRKVSETRYNCIPAAETSPPAEMIKAALALREKMKFDEPMFRSLLRIRKAVAGGSDPIG